MTANVSPDGRFLLIQVPLSTEQGKTARGNTMILNTQWTAVESISFKLVVIRKEYPVTKRQLITMLEKLPMSDDSEVQVVLKPEQVGFLDDTQWWSIHHVEIGRASCRERV